jgi:D-alanyl-D-alanine carboxypeptidase
MKMSAVMATMGALALAAAASPRRAEPGFDTAVRVLEAEVASGRAPAVQYRHFTRSGVILAWSGGMADLASGKSVDDSTLFAGFSVTKTVTAVAVLQLVERGLVDLDAPASAYLPEMPYGEAITVRHLLSHSAGIRNPLPLAWVHLEEEHADFDAPAFFRGVFATHARARGAPGERLRYSNLGYVLLGRLIEHVSGLPYEEYVEQNVLHAIDLSPAELGFGGSPGQRATGYHRRWSPSRLLLRFVIDDARYLRPGTGRWQAFRPYRVNGAAYGGLIGTADGFTRYVQALLDPASGLLNEGSRRELLAEHLLAGGRGSGMALSWFTGELHGHDYRAHAGGGGGFYAEIRLYPELGRGSVLLLNRSGFSDARFLDRIDRHLLPGAGVGAE